MYILAARTRRHAVLSSVIVACLLALVGCGGGSPADGRPPQVGTAAGSEKVAQRCGPPEPPAAETLRLRTADGVRLDGVAVGGGKVGVLIVHQYPSDLCDGWPYGVRLAREGYRVLLVDLRCFGESGCLGGDKRADLVEDVRAGVGELEDRGAEEVFLLGASMGGAVVLEAAAEIRPPVAGVVSLSGEADLGRFVPSLPIAPEDSMGKVESPLLMVVSKQDRYLPVEDARDMTDAAGTKDGRLVVLPAAMGHGFETLGYPPDWSRADDEVLRFLKEHS